MPKEEKKNISVPFPVGGIVDGTPHGDQPPNTTHDSKNVLPFDAEEGRGRGGRRDGLRKLNDQSMGLTPVQLLLPMGVNVASGELVTGSVSEFPSDHVDFPGEGALLDYGTLSNGTAIDAVSLGHPLYGHNYTGALGYKASGAYVHLVDHALTSSSWVHSSYGNTMLFHYSSANGSYWTIIRPLVITGQNPGMYKMEDDSGVPYISVEPNKFQFGRPTNAGYPSGTYSSPPELLHSHTAFGGLNKTVNQATHSFNDAGTSMRIWKHTLLMPKHDINESAWNTASQTADDKPAKFATRMEFAFPEAPSHKFAADGVDGRVIMAETQADEDAGGDNYLYDPWYSYVRTNNGANGWGNDDQNTFDVFGEWDEKIGLIFRVAIDFNRIEDNNITDWWNSYQKNSTDEAAIMVYFDRDIENGDGRVSDVPWDLKIHTVNGNLSEVFGNDQQTEVTVVEGIFPGTDTQYHTLEVKFDGDRMDIYVDGTNRYSNGDIKQTFPTVSIKGSASTTNSYGTWGYGHGGIISHFTNHIKRPIEAHGTTQSVQNIAYFCSYDWGNREAPPESTVGTGSVSSTHTDDRGGGASWKLRSLEHRVLSANSSEDKTVLAITAGRAYESTSLGSFVPAGFDPVISPGSDLVDGITFFTKAYLVDGKNYKVYDPVTNTSADWDATGSSITLPGGDGSTGSEGTGTYDENPRCTIIETYNGRIVMAGKSDEGNNWFMSAIGDPLDWDISQLVTLGGAVSGTNSSIGEASEFITALVPMDGDRLLIAGTSTISMLTEDPKSETAQLVNLSRETGIVGQYAWCYGPYKTVFLVGENGLYSIKPNEFDVNESDRVSLGRLDKTFSDIDFAKYNCRLVYDNALHGVHIFLAPTNQTNEPNTHYYFDTRANSFWKIEMPGVVGPTAVTSYSALDPTDRGLLMGGYDGYVRTFSSQSKDDDGTAIDSYTWIGPLMISNDREAKLSQLIAVLDEQTESLDYEIYAADTVEAAKTGTPIVSGSWSGGRNPSNRMRVRGSALFIKIKSGSVSLPWSLENLTATLAVAGKVRQR